MTEGPVRIGLVGAGGIARTHLSRYTKLADAKIAAVCDTDLDTARRAVDSLLCTPIFESVEVMLEETELDAVDICTPPAFHAEAAMQAIEKGLNVLSEKPLSQDAATARKIAEAADLKGVLLMTGFCHRFHPPIAFVHEKIEAGDFGQIVMFRNRFAGPAKMEDRWFSRKAIAGGGAFIDTSIHSVDLFRFLVGEPTRVEAVMRRTSPAIKEVEDTAIALLATADNRMGTVECSWALPEGYNVVEVFGERGVAMIHYWDGMASRYKTTRMKDWEPLPEKGDRFANELQHFLDACLGRTSLKVTGHDGVRAIEIAEAAYQSAGSW